MNIGKIIKEIRLKKGLNQKDLANAIDINQAYLSQIEQNKKEPSMEILKRISIGLNVPLPILILISAEEKDIPKSKKKAFHKIFPSVESMMKNLFIN